MKTLHKTILTVATPCGTTIPYTPIGYGYTTHQFFYGKLSANDDKKAKEVFIKAPLRDCVQVENIFKDDGYDFGKSYEWTEAKCFKVATHHIVFLGKEEARAVRENLESIE